MKREHARSRSCADSIIYTRCNKTALFTYLFDFCNLHYHSSWQLRGTFVVVGVLLLLHLGQVFQIILGRAHIGHWSKMPYASSHSCGLAEEIDVIASCIKHCNGFSQHCLSCSKKYWIWCYYISFILNHVHRLTRESGPSQVGFGSENEFIRKVKDIWGNYVCNLRSWNVTYLS